jgi:hypothetical protein
MYEDHYFPNITRREKAANKFHSRKASDTFSGDTLTDKRCRSLLRHAPANCYVSGRHASSDHEVAHRLTGSYSQLDGPSSLSQLEPGGRVGSKSEDC